MESSTLTSLLPDHWTPILDYLYDVHVYRLVLTCPRIAQRVRLGLKTLHLSFSSLDTKKLHFWPSLTHLISHSSLEGWNPLAQLPHQLKSFVSGYISGKVPPQSLPPFLTSLSVTAPFVTWSVISALPQTLLHLKVYECHTFHDDMGALLPRNLLTFHLLGHTPFCTCGGKTRHLSLSAVSDMLFRNFPPSLTDVRVQTSLGFSALSLILLPPTVTTLRLSPLFMQENSYRSIPASVSTLILDNFKSSFSIPAHLKKTRKVVVKWQTLDSHKNLNFSDIDTLFTPHLQHLTIGGSVKFNSVGDWSRLPALQVLKLENFDPSLVTFLPPLLRVFHCVKFEREHDYTSRKESQTHLIDFPRTLTDLICPMIVSSAELEDLPPAIVRCAFGSHNHSYRKQRPSIGDLTGELPCKDERTRATIESWPEIPLSCCYPPLYEILRETEPIHFSQPHNKHITLERYLEIVIDKVFGRRSFEKRMAKLSRKNLSKHSSMEIEEEESAEQLERSLKPRAAVGNPVCGHCDFKPHITFNREALYLNQFEKDHMTAMEVNRALICGPLATKKKKSKKWAATSSEGTSDATVDDNDSKPTYAPTSSDDTAAMDVDEPLEEPQMPPNFFIDYPTNLDSLSITDNGKRLTADICKTLPSTLTALKIVKWMYFDDISSLTQLRHLFLHRVSRPIHSLPTGIVCLSLLNCGFGGRVLEIVEALQKPSQLPNLKSLTVGWSDSSRESSEYADRDPGDEDDNSIISIKKSKKEESSNSPSRALELIKAAYKELAAADHLERVGLGEVKMENIDVEKSDKKKKLKDKTMFLPAREFDTHPLFAIYCVLKLIKHPSLSYLAISKDVHQQNEADKTGEILSLATSHIDSPLKYVTIARQHFTRPDDHIAPRIAVDSAWLQPNLPLWKPIPQGNTVTAAKKATNKEEKLDVSDVHRSHNKPKDRVWKRTYPLYFEAESSRSDITMRVAPPCDPPSHPRDVKLDEQELLELFTTPHPSSNMSGQSSSSSGACSAQDHLWLVPSPPLSALRLYQNTTLSASAFAPPTGDMLHHLLEYGPQPLDLLSHLQTLVVFACDTWTDETVSHLPRSLTELTMSSKCITDGFTAFLPPNLRTLVLTKANTITDKAIPHLPRSLKFLSMPSNTILTDVAAKHLPPELERLNLQSNSKFTNEALASLPRTLNSLYLTFWNPPPNSVSDAGMMALPPSLTELWMNQINTVTSACFMYLPRSLLILSLSAVYEIRASDLQMLPPHLHRLHLNGSVKLKDTDLVLLPNTIARLRIGVHHNNVADLPLLQFDSGLAR